MSDLLILLLGIGAIALGIVLLVVMIFLQNRKAKETAWKQTALQKLDELKNQHLDLSSEIINLDKILEFVLQSRFYNKSNLGNLLKTYATSFDRNDLNQLWQVHKLRNKIVHDIHFKPSYLELTQSKKILQEQIKKSIHSS